MPWKAPQEKIEGSAWSSNRIRTKPVPTNKIGKTCKSWDIEVSTQEVLVPEWAWLQTHLTNNEVKMKVLVTQSCPILCDPEDYRLLCPWDYPGKTTGVGSYSFLPGDLPNPGIKARSPALAGRFFTIWATREASTKRSFFPSNLTVSSQNIKIYRNVKIYNIKQGKKSQCKTSKITRQAKKQENMTHNENNNLLVFFSC